jgi:asparagine synthetase B (glutamine-hydrolysing)
MAFLPSPSGPAAATLLRLLFASEIKAILEHSAVDRTIDPSALPFYLTDGYVPTPWTLYRRIRKLPPREPLGPRARSRCVRVVVLGHRLHTAADPR